MPGHLGPAPGPWDGWVATAFVNRMMLRMETLGGVLGSYRPGPGGGGDSGKLWWVGHRPLEIQDSSRGSGCGVHSTTGPEHQQLPFHTFSGSPHLPGVGAPGTGCLEPLLSGVPSAWGPSPQGPCPWGPRRSQASARPQQQLELTDCSALGLGASCLWGDGGGKLPPGCLCVHMLGASVRIWVC